MKDKSADGTMGATMRITWLLLSLHFILHGVCSDDDTQSATTESKGTIPVTNTVAVITADKASDPQTPTQPPPTDVTQLPTFLVETKDHIASPTGMTPQPAVATDPTQQKATDIPPVTAGTITEVPPTATIGAIIATAAATTLDPHTVATTAGSSSSVVQSPTTQGQTTDPLKPTVSGTEPTVTMPGNPSEGGTTKAADAKTDNLTPGPGGSEGTAQATMGSQNDKEAASTMKVTQAAATEAETPTKTSEMPVDVRTTSASSSVTEARTSSTGVSNAEAGVTSSQTTQHAPKVTIAPTPAAATTTTATTTTVPPPQKMFSYSLKAGPEDQAEKEMVEVCKKLMVNMEDGNCTLMWKHGGKISFDKVEISGKVKNNVATQYLEEITKKPTDTKTLIAILASCGALLIMIVILAVCASHHRKPYNENQQHLTEELHTVENGYHDNPTLEVMEVQPEMQEKKMALNGEFNDSWIVPIDNLLKEDIPDEEDTHL